jgi:hypothetical protein
VDKDDIFTKCKWNGKPPNGTDDCEPFLDDGDGIGRCWCYRHMDGNECGVGRCWCYRYMDGNEWCNIVNCEKDVNTKT